MTVTHEASVSDNQGDAPRRGPLFARYAISASVQLGALAVAALAQVRRPADILDPGGLHDSAVRIVHSWNGVVPPSPARLHALTGSRTWGSDLFQASIYKVFGNEPTAARIVYALITALVAPSIWWITCRFTPSRRVRMTAFVVAAFWPALIFWTILGQKDAYMSGIMCFGAALAISRPRPWSAIFLGVLALVSSYLRQISGFAVVVFLIALVSAQRPHKHWRSIAVSCLLGVAIAAIGVIPTYLGQDAGELTYQRVETHEAKSHRKIVKRTIVSVSEGGSSRLAYLVDPKAVIRGTVGPIPFVGDDAGEGAYRWLYPNTMVWAPTLALGMLGLWHALRRRKYEALAVLTLIASYIAFYVISLEGLGQRQRVVVEPLMIPLAALGVEWLRSTRVLRSRSSTH